MKETLNVPVHCLLAGEDSFLDSLPEPHRAESWQLAQERAAEIDCFVAPSAYFANRMADRLKLRRDRVRVIPLGINLDGFCPADDLPNPPVLGYFARMCVEKGLPTLVEAFVRLKRRDRVKGLKLRVGGGMSPVDEAAVVNSMRARLQKEGLLELVEFRPNLTRAEKVEFYQSLSVLSVPALFGEAFGLYLIEAWASGVPVVQPRHAAFPELLEQTGAGVLCEPDDPESLADGVERVLLDPSRLAAMRLAGRRSALKHFGIERMAQAIVDAFQSAKDQNTIRARHTESVAAEMSGNGVRV
jgi:glycosyltransferase involved in cell wall biosynthesis